MTMTAIPFLEYEQEILSLPMGPNLKDAARESIEWG
jgi:hypothetical protein